jgi:hypothetical protein
MLRKATTAKRSWRAVHPRSPASYAVTTATSTPIAQIANCMRFIYVRHVATPNCLSLLWQFGISTA